MRSSMENLIEPQQQDGCGEALDTVPALPVADEWPHGQGIGDAGMGKAKTGMGERMTCMMITTIPLPEQLQLQLKGEIVAAENECKLQKALFRALLEGLLVAEDPQTVIEDILGHIFEYANARFLEGYDFRDAVAEIYSQEEVLEREASQDIETCGRAGE